MGTMTSTHLSPLTSKDNLLPNWLLILFSIEPFVTLGPVSLPCILTALNTNTSRVLLFYAYLVSMQRIVWACDESVGMSPISVRSLAKAESASRSTFHRTVTLFSVCNFLSPPLMIMIYMYSCIQQTDTEWLVIAGLLTPWARVIPLPLFSEG